MEGKTYFWKRKKMAIFLAVLASLSGFLLLLFEQNAYTYSSFEAATSQVEKIITIDANGDVRFQETLQRYFSTRVFFQDIDFNSNHEDIPPSVARPGFDSTRFYSAIYDSENTKLIESFGQRATRNIQGDNLILDYSWNPGALDELGDPILPLYDNSVSWFHYHAGTWGNIKVINDYYIQGVALKYADTAEFYWVVASTDFMLTENIDVKVVLPGINLDPNEVQAYIHGASLGSIHHLGVNDNNQTYVHVKAARLFPGEYVTVRINFPADRLVIPSLQNQRFGNDVSNYPLAGGRNHLDNVTEYEAARVQARNIYNLVDILGIVIVLLILALTGWKTWQIYQTFDKEHPTDFYGEYYRELPNDYGPAMMGYLYRFKEISKDDVTATLMDLIRRKAITIDTQGQSLVEANVNYTLIKNPSFDVTTLLPHELQLLKWFFDVVGDGKTLTLKRLEDFTKQEQQAQRYLQENQTFNRAVNQAAVQYRFFDDVKADVQAKSGFLGLAIVFAVGLYVLRFMFALGTYTGVFGGVLFGVVIALQAYLTSIERRSKQGNEDYVRWKAFEKFLKEFTNIKDYSMPGIVVWEHYMVYATAFGIADLVEKQVRFKYTQLQQVETLNQSTMFRYPGFYRVYYYSMARSFYRANQTIAQANAQRHNSAGGGGGRFGGGGGFRGGGGSGVRIR